MLCVVSLHRPPNTTPACATTACGRNFSKPSHLCKSDAIAPYLWHFQGRRVSDGGKRGTRTGTLPRVCSCFVASDSRSYSKVPLFGQIQPPRPYRFDAPPGISVMMTGQKASFQPGPKMEVKSRRPEEAATNSRASYLCNFFDMEPHCRSDGKRVSGWQRSRRDQANTGASSWFWSRTSALSNRNTNSRERTQQDFRAFHVPRHRTYS